MRISALGFALVCGTTTAVWSAPLSVTLTPASSDHPFSVAEVRQDSLPEAATWLRVADPSNWRYGDKCWFHRTVPKNASTHQGPIGIQQLPFSALADAAPGTNITLVVEAWSDRNDLGDGSKAELLATSGSLTFTYDDKGFSSKASFVNFTAVQTAIGDVTISAQPADTGFYQYAKLVSWYGYLPAPSAAADSTSAENKLPTFTLDTALVGDQYFTREFPKPSINVSFSQPGVHFVGIYSAWNGEYGESSGTGVHLPPWPRDSTGKGFQPFAIITPWENGTVPALPPNFDGPKFVTKPIPGDWRLALRVDHMTVFNGGVVYVRAVNGPAYPNGGAWAPQVVELDVPKGLRIIVPVGGGITGGVGYQNVTDVTQDAGGGPVPAGYQRLRLNKQTAYEWSYLNIAIELLVEVDKDLEGKSFPLSRIRAYSGATGQQRSDNWQALAITVEALVPVPALPKRLHTAFCWAEPDIFVDDATRGLLSVGTWKALGFNTVPTDGASYATPPGPLGGDNPGGLLAPDNRTGPEWKDMKYGIMTSPFGSGGLSAAPYGLGTFSAITMPVAAASSTTVFNFTAHGLSAAQESSERAQWKAALEFYQTYKMMDISYDGFFKQYDLGVVSQLVNFSQPDYFSMDIESFPELEAWLEVGFHSANYKKLPGESDSEAVRDFGLAFAPSFVRGYVSALRHWTAYRSELARRHRTSSQCVPSAFPLHLSSAGVSFWRISILNSIVIGAVTEAAKPDVKTYLYDIWAAYDAGYQITSWPMAAEIGLADMPSYYGVENGLDYLAAKIKTERLAVGTSTELIPWLTPGQTGGTGGPHSGDPGVAFFNMLIQCFANGATGFNVYTSIGVYDMSLWLAMRNAIALVTPYEDIIMDGTPVASTTFTEVAETAVVSAMVSTGQGMLIASSTLPHGMQTSFTVTGSHALAVAADWLLCDLATLKSVAPSSDGAVTWSAESENGSVLLLAQRTPCHQERG